MTLQLMKYFNIEFHEIDSDEKLEIVVKSGKYTISDEYHIEPDASTAAYDALIAAVHGFDVEIMNLNQHSIQGESKFID